MKSPTHIPTKSPAREEMNISKLCHQSGPSFLLNLCNTCRIIALPFFGKPPTYTIVPETTILLCVPAS
ncbi:hypothetical protein ACFLQU_03265 [Verrucomicrobiota bacterium]